jgi:hypothetical protein
MISDIVSGDNGNVEQMQPVDADVAFMDHTRTAQVVDALTDPHVFENFFMPEEEDELRGDQHKTPNKGRPCNSKRAKYSCKEGE